MTPSPGYCKSCGQSIYWATYAKKDGTHGTMPVDCDPSPKGNVQLFLKRDGSVRAVVLPKDQAENIRVTARTLGSPDPLRLSHFATCINAKSHRRAS